MRLEPYLLNFLQINSKKSTLLTSFVLACVQRKANFLLTSIKTIRGKIVVIIFWVTILSFLLKRWYISGPSFQLFTTFQLIHQKFARLYDTFIFILSVLLLCFYVKHFYQLFWTTECFYRSRWLLQYIVYYYLLSWILFTCLHSSILLIFIIYNHNQSGCTHYHN